MEQSLVTFPNITGVALGMLEVSESPIFASTFANWEPNGKVQDEVVPGSGGGRLSHQRGVIQPPGCRTLSKSDRTELQDHPGS